MLALGHVLDEQAPRHFAAFDQALIHAEDIAAPLRLVGAERAGRVEDARVDEPAGAGLEAIGLGEIEDAVVALVPVFEALADLRLGRAGLEAHEGVGEIVADVVVLRREVIGLRLAFLADELRLLGALVHVMRNRPHVVEELRVDRPLAVLLPDRLADERRAAVGDRLPQREAFACRRRSSSGLRPARGLRWRRRWSRRTSARRCRRGSGRRRRCRRDGA